MSDGRACPNELALERLARGQMGLDEAAATKAHVLDCALCTDALERSFRPLVEALVGQRLGNDTAEEVLVERVLSRMRGRSSAWDGLTGSHSRTS